MHVTEPQSKEHGDSLRDTFYTATHNTCLQMSPGCRSGLNGRFYAVYARPVNWSHWLVCLGELTPYIFFSPCWDQNDLAPKRDFPVGIGMVGQPASDSEIAPGTEQTEFPLYESCTVPAVLITICDLIGRNCSYSCN